MRIYQINYEHKVSGLNWSSKKVSTKSFKEALEKAEKGKAPYEKIEDIRLLETTEN